MRSIKEQRRDNALGVEQIELLDWAERARANIYEFQSRLGNYEYCDEDDSCPCVFCVAAKLLKELPEE